MDEDKKINMDIADTLIEMPQGFSVGDKHFYLYPVTIGKMYLMQRIVDNMEINHALLMVNPFAEAIRLAGTNRLNCCRLLAYHTLRTKKEVCDNDLVAQRSEFFFSEIDDESLAQILILILSADKTTEFIHHLGIDDENKRYAKACAAKKDSNTLTFGGRSIYGSLIDFACERYGWTLDYVVWGVSHTNLQLLLADSVKTVYLTDEERKKSHLSNERPISGDNPMNNDLITSMKWD